MTLTIQRDEQGFTKLQIKGIEPVKVKILAPTRYVQFGQEEVVEAAAGEVVNVHIDEHWPLIHNEKGELATAEDVDQKAATIEELEAEVIAAGYSPEAAKKIAKDRFDGVHGDGARFLGAEVEVNDDDEEVLAEFTADDLAKKTKAELVVFGAEHFALELSENSKKEELVSAIVEAAAKASQK